MNFLKKHGSYLVFFIALVWVLLYSFQTLTTKPRLWVDESVNIELARNFSLFGKLDAVVAPGVFSGRQTLLQSTGYPVTLPLALFFKIFGFGLVQARVYMVIWLVFLLWLVFLFIQKTFGVDYAAWSVLLIAGLAPFYANGRCVMGEIPGFLFLLLGAYFLWHKKNAIFTSGIFFGLAVVAKPSIYLLLLPALVISVILEKDHPIKKIITVFSGAALPALAWVIINVSNPFSTAEWGGIFAFYRKPFGEVSIWANIAQNSFSLFTQSTLIYFSALFLAIMAAIFLNRNFYRRHKNFLIFFIAYCILALLYFLKSPGWLRYIVAGQFLILMILPYALEMILERIKFKKEKVARTVFSFLSLFFVLSQMLHLVYGADIFESNSPQIVAGFINARSADKTIGFVDSPLVSSLAESPKKFQMIKMLGLPVFGKNPLALETKDLPGMLVVLRGGADLAGYENVIGDNYELIEYLGGYDIYQKKI